MDHAVHYRTSAGETRLEEVASLDAAISMVERLRNDEGVSDVRVYRQVPIEFKAYYKVTVVEGQPTSANGSSATADTSTPAAPAAAPASAAPSAPQSPPPGAMPLGPSTPTAQPSAQPAAQPSASAPAAEPQGNEDGESTRRGSLFSRG